MATIGLVVPRRIPTGTVPIPSTAETTAASRIVVAPGTERVAVQAAKIEALQTNGSVTDRRAITPAPGFPVLHPPGDSEQVVGVRRFSAGVSESVAVRIREAFSRHRERRFDLSIARSRDDGAGVFDSSETVMRSGEDGLETTVKLERTPVATPAGGDGHDHEYTGQDGPHHEENGSSTDDADGSRTHEEGESHDDSTATDELATEASEADGTGPGPLFAIVATAVASVRVSVSRRPVC
jgi:hypothetical protein